MILITGASTGIGFATALHLHKQGHTVVAGVRKEADGLKIKQAAGQSTNMIPVILDVTRSEQIALAKNQISQILQERKQVLTGIVNNAGIVVVGPLEHLPMQELKKQIDVNVYGMLEVTQAFLPELRKSNGRIVNISSIAGKTVTPLMVPYCISKHAVECLSDGLRMELKEAGIEVCVIEPGSIATPIWEKSAHTANELFAGLSPESEKNYGKMIASFKVLTSIFAKKAEPAAGVVAAIEHALTATKPKTRYLVGKDARMVMIQNIFPDRVRDKLVLGVVNKYRT